MAKKLWRFWINPYLFWGGLEGVWLEYINFLHTIECSFIRVSRGLEGVWKGLGQDIHLYRRSKRCESLALYGSHVSATPSQLYGTAILEAEMSGARSEADWGADLPICDTNDCGGWR